MYLPRPRANYRHAKSFGVIRLFELELELIQSHMAQKPVLRGEVGCACVAREVSVDSFISLGVSRILVITGIGTCLAARYDLFCVAAAFRHLHEF